MSGGGIILGVSADFHDAAAALVVDGQVVAAAEEERFSRVKHDAGLPERAIEWCLEFAAVRPGDLTCVAFYEKPLTAYERLLVTMGRGGPRNFPSLARSVARWSRSRLWIGARIDRVLQRSGHRGVPLLFAEHHQSHAAAAFFPSPFESAAILTFDGVGEWTTTSVGRGRGNRIDLLVEQRYPHSLGLLYSTITALCGFDVNDGEQKVMALAPYGTPRFRERLDRVIDLADDGSFQLRTEYFDFESGTRMGSRHLDRLLELTRRAPGDAVGQQEADLAASMQSLLEDVVLRIARGAHERTGETSVCLAGGVALNCVANGVLLREGPFDDVWVPPSPGDSGSALGAALWAWHQVDGHPRRIHPGTDAMNGAFLGPSYSSSEVADFLSSNEVAHTTEPFGDRTIAQEVARRLADGELVGWFAGRMEFGPRALGHRSILADPRDPRSAARINDAVKRRHSFQPFAPAVLAERSGEWFSDDRPLPYMSVATTVATNRWTQDHDAGTALGAPGARRSTIPACTHVDMTARVQTVDEVVNPEFHEVLREFEALTGCPVLLNTSFNGRGEPIVCTPADALRSFRTLGLDALALEGHLIERVPAVAQAVSVP